MLIPSFRGESAYNAEYNSSTFPFTKQGIYVTQMKLTQKDFWNRETSSKVDKYLVLIMFIFIQVSVCLLFECHSSRAVK